MGARRRGPEHHPPAKKMNEEALLAFRDRFGLPLTDEQVRDARVLQAARRQRRDDLPARAPRRARRQPAGARTRTCPRSRSPALGLRGAARPARGERDDLDHDGLRAGARPLVRDKGIGRHVVPIVPDESRTFGMEGMFRQLGIFSQVGQLYSPEDAEQLMYYREDKKGQILQEGINEAGAVSSWIAAATSYANHGVPMIPFFIFYSMFGFQRIGDLIWAAGDSRSRGFLLGAHRRAARPSTARACSTRTATATCWPRPIPNCVAYDPTFGYELAVIVQDGLRRMLTEQRGRLLLPHADQRELPAAGDARGRGRGHPARHAPACARREGKGPRVRLLGSGTILREVARRRPRCCSDDYGVAADVWSVTSFTELRRDGLEVERWNRLHPTEQPRRAVRRGVPRRRPAARWSPRPTTCARSPTRSGPTSPAASRCSAPTASAAATTAAKLRGFFEVDRAPRRGGGPRRPRP